MVSNWANQGAKWHGTLRLVHSFFPVLCPLAHFSCCSLSHLLVALIPPSYTLFTFLPFYLSGFPSSSSLLPSSFLHIHFQDTSTTGKQQTRSHHTTTTTTSTYGKLGFWRQGQVPPRVPCSHGKQLQHPSGYISQPHLLFFALYRRRSNRPNASNCSSEEGTQSHSHHFFFFVVVMGMLMCRSRRTRPLLELVFVRTLIISWESTASGW